MNQYAARVPLTYHLTRIRGGMASEYTANLIREKMKKAGVTITLKLDRVLRSIANEGGNELEAQYIWDLAKKVSAAARTPRKKQVASAS